MRRKIELEYIFSSSVKVLFSRLSTPAGLSEWFADDVFQKLIQKQSNNEKFTENDYVARLRS